MKFVIDHDLHIHSKTSLCSSDPEQTVEALLNYALTNNLKKICVTDHFWDENISGAMEWYQKQNFSHVTSILPLPQNDKVEFLFGCETELDKNMTLGISRESIDKFDFVVIPTNHLHMSGFTIEDDVITAEERAEIYVHRLDGVLDMDLPFEKIGIAHLTCGLMGFDCYNDFESHIRIIDAINDKTFKALFSKFAEKGAGLELNFNPSEYNEEQLKRILRPYKIAKSLNCKFYLASDAHHPNDLSGAMTRFKDIVELLELKESDKFEFAKNQLQ